MMRFLMPIIFLGISSTVFFTFTNPLYDHITELKALVASYDEALGNSKALENERDKLTAKYNGINKENLVKLTKLLPQNIDNIRLILEIEQIASPFGMVLKDVKYNTSANDSVKSSGTNTGTSPAVSPVATVGGVSGAQSSRKDYGVWDLGFSTVGTYNNFINFTKALESNLRIVDISSISFSSSSDGSRIGASLSSGLSSSTVEAYKYDFKIKTYWLRN